MLLIVAFYTDTIAALLTWWNLSKNCTQSATTAVDQGCTAFYTDTVATWEVATHRFPSPSAAPSLAAQSSELLRTEMPARTTQNYYSRHRLPTNEDLWLLWIISSYSSTPDQDNFCKRNVWDTFTLNLQIYLGTFVHCLTPHHSYHCHQKG